VGPALSIRALAADDLVGVQGLIRACPPLQLHTPYTYWVILDKYGSHCAGIFDGENAVGLVLAIPVPEQRLFVWQIGVLPRLRGDGLSGRLLRHIWRAATREGMTSLETTIAEDNPASRSAFEAFAQAEGLNLRPSGAVTVRDADGVAVDDEIVYRLEAVQNS
jgi:L-2,4-diaminobutyric acid acetyltransferase